MSLSRSLWQFRLYLRPPVSLEVGEVDGGVAGEVGAGHHAAPHLTLAVADIAQLSVLWGDLAEVLQLPDLVASAGAVGLHAGQERVLK